MKAHSYTVVCGAEGCGQPAQYKIASHWSDGATGELKTYGLACETHVESLYRRAQEKRARCRLAEGEVLSPPGVFRLEPGRRDRELQRAAELESKFA